MTERERYRAMFAQLEKIQMHTMINASQSDRAAFPMAACYWALLSVMNNHCTQQRQATTQGG